MVQGEKRYFKYFKQSIIKVVFFKYNTAIMLHAPTPKLLAVKEGKTVKSC